MAHFPFGQTVRLWRLHRGLTQAALARAAGLPRPNLSAIERGRRDVSLATLRTLAAALEVPTGALVDGLAPTEIQGVRPALSRAAVERIADAAARDRRVEDPREQTVVLALRVLLGSRMRSMRRQYRRPRLGHRRVLESWMLLKSLYDRQAIRVLADRVMERQHIHATTDH